MDDKYMKIKESKDLLLENWRTSVIKVIRKRKMKQTRHLLRMEEIRSPKQIFSNYKPEGKDLKQGCPTFFPSTVHFLDNLTMLDTFPSKSDKSFAKIKPVFDSVIRQIS